jgi:hypothetical protein
MHLSFSAITSYKLKFLVNLFADLQITQVYGFYDECLRK